MFILLFMISIGMSGNENAGPFMAWLDTSVLVLYEACVKVDDCYDSSSVGIITRVKSLENICWECFPTD
jgi:hypothetical protein